MEDPSYFAIIPANVRYCAELTANEKLLYGEITTLCNKTGECWATNSYFARLYNTTDRTVRRWISNLVRLGFIRSVVSNEDGNTRHICIVSPADKNVHTLGQKCPNPTDKNVLTPTDKNVLYNNTSKNNTSMNKENIPSITHTEGIRNTGYMKEIEIPPVGDVLRGRRVGVNDLPRPTKKTVPEDYGLVKFDLSEIQVGDYERLLNWFEYHHREKATGKVLRPYCEKVFKQNVDLIKTLSNECWYYAVDCIEGAVNLGYQGFGKSDGFFYRAISLEDYEDDLKIIKGFRIYPESLPERFARYRPLVYDMAEKYFVDWIANHPDLDNTESEKKLAEIRAVKKGWTS